MSHSILYSLPALTASTLPEGPLRVVICLLPEGAALQPAYMRFKSR